MDLQGRITALAQAIGADVKYLLSRKPVTSMVWTFQPVAASKAGATLAYFAGAVPGYLYVYNTSSAVGDFATWRGDIWPGTWTFRFHYITQSNLGIVNLDYSLDEGATWTSYFANKDFYSAAQTGYLFLDKTGVVVTSSQPTILFRWTSAGKNASSTGNIFLAGPVSMVRTA